LLNEQLNNYSRRFGFFIKTIGIKNSDKTVLNDFLIIDPIKNEIKIINGYHLLTPKKDSDTFKIPALSNHQIVNLNNRDILVFSGTHSYGKRNRDFLINGILHVYTYSGEGMEFYYFTNSNFCVLKIVLNENEAFEGAKRHITHSFIKYSYTRNSYKHPVVSKRSSTIPFKKNFTTTSTKFGIYLFGGRLNSGFGSNDLYVINTTSDPHEMDCFQVFYKKENAPKPRHSHSAVNFNNDLLIYGGIHNDNWLNDIYVFDTSAAKWKEIIPESSLVPPRISNYSFEIMNQKYLLIYGGVSKDNELQNNFYCFNISSKEWSLVKVMGNKSSNDLNQDLQIPIKGHLSSYLGNKLYLVGGYTGKKEGNEILTINELNQDDMNPNILIVEHLKKSRKEKSQIDICFKVPDEEGNEKSIYAHKCIVAARCGKFAELNNIKEDEVKISDGITSEVFEVFIHYLYSGEITMNGEKNIKMLLDYVKKYDDDLYKEIYSISTLNSKYLSLTSLISNNLINQIQKLVNKDYFSDLKIVIKNEEETTEILCHKVIISRAPYFNSMLNSGFLSS
jgi:hypothetical protein